jgi:adenosylmethionine-8-amino-7-oxononanoate aminotransferase
VVVEPCCRRRRHALYDPAFLRRPRAVHRHDVFLVFDEVFTGYGRSGPMWAAQHAGVSPDLLCTAKGFTGGLLPMGATLATPRIFEGFLGLPARAFYYGHTFCGHPLGAAVALEVLRIFEEEKILARAAPPPSGDAASASRARATRHGGGLDLPAMRAISRARAGASTGGASARRLSAAAGHRHG